jgi:hypothetical protein
MRNSLLMRALPTLITAMTAVFLVALGQPGQAMTVSHANVAGGPSLQARVTGTPLVGPDPVWHVAGIFSEGAGYSSVFTRPSYQNGVANITGSPMRSVPDITMDASDGTSQAAPLFNGILALATQANHGNLDPINPLLYKKLGPKGAKVGIADVVKGNNSVVVNGKVTVPGFTAAKGFDVATGWGTISAPSFVPALVAAAHASHGDAVARRQAQAQLAGLEHSTTLTVTDIPHGGRSYLLGTGFLPNHPVSFTIDGRAIATLTANALGDVTYMIDPSMLGLPPGKHTARLSGMVLTTTTSFTSHRSPLGQTALARPAPAGPEQFDHATARSSASPAASSLRQASRSSGPMAAGRSVTGSSRTCTRRPSACTTDPSSDRTWKP